MYICKHTWNLVESEVIVLNGLKVIRSAGCIVDVTMCKWQDIIKEKNTCEENKLEKANESSYYFGGREI